MLGNESGMPATGVPLPDMAVGVMPPTDTPAGGMPPK
jgi:hypothetical protein